MCADIHDGPEHEMLQSEAGYIDARPHIRQLAEVLLTARPDHTLGQERTSPAHLAMSALPLKADKAQTGWHVRFVPKADICSAANSIAIRSLRLRWRARPAGW